MDRGGQGGGGDRGGRRDEPSGGASCAQDRRKLRRTGGIHGGRPAARGGCRAHHGENRPVPFARRVSRRRAPCRLRIPARARSRHRALQGTAAGLVLHRRGHERQSRAGLGPAAARGRAGRGAYFGEVRSDVRYRQGRQRAERNRAAPSTGGVAGRRVCVRPVRGCRSAGHIRTRDGAAAGRRRHGLDAAVAACFCSAGQAARALARASCGAGVRHDHRSRQPGDHRRLRARRTDPFAGAAHVRHSVHGARSELPAGGFRQALRQQGVLRRRVAARAARGGEDRRGEALRSGDRRCRSLGQDGRGRAQALSARSDTRARAQPRAPVSSARPRRRAHLARNLSGEPRDGAASDRAVSLFKQHDEQQLNAQYAVQHDEAQLIQTTKEAAAQLQQLFEADSQQPPPGFPQPAATAGRNT